MTAKRALQTLAVTAVAFSLAGCVSLFPKAKPVQLYRFGVSDAPPAAAAPGAVRIARTPTAFARAAANDRLLAVTGQETAYISGGRWISPAAVMFDDTVEHAFDARPGGPRLVTRGDLTTADVALRLDVDTFETRYLDGPKAAPTVAVSMTATLVRLRDRAVMGEKVFAAQKRAGDNRMGAIAAAYDGAVKESVGAMVDWAASTTGG